MNNTEKRTHPKLKKFDKVIVGLFIGLIAPMLLLFFVYKTNYGNLSIADFITYALKLKILLRIVTMCTLPNVGSFYFFINQKMNNGARGVLASFFVYAIIMMAILYF